jgi:hypothetical protein
MAFADSPREVVREAIARRDPRLLARLDPLLNTWAGALELRTRLQVAEIHPEDHGVVVGWILDADPEIASRARRVVLLLDNPGLNTAIFNHLADLDLSEPPFLVSYNQEEREFHVDLPGTPGWGVSRYGRGNPVTDRLLNALERFYARVNP